MQNVSPRGPIDELSFESKDFNQEGSIQSSTIEVASVHPNFHDGLKVASNIIAGKSLAKSFVDTKKFIKSKASLKDQIMEFLKEGASIDALEGKQPLTKKKTRTERLRRLIRVRVMPLIFLMKNFKREQKLRT